VTEGKRGRGQDGRGQNIELRQISRETPGDDIAQAQRACKFRRGDGLAMPISGETGTFQRRLVTNPPSDLAGKSYPSDPAGTEIGREEIDKKVPG